MSKIKNGGLDQYGAEHFKQQQFGPAGIEWVNRQLFTYYNDTFVFIFLQSALLQLVVRSSCLAVCNVELKIVTRA